ncbi:hypothetical protein VTO42DRAFT_4404 [Malbranchea cinnamomea]
MADLDDELLALAGEGSDSDASDSERDEKSASPPPNSSKEQQSDSSGKMGRKGIARPVSKRKKVQKEVEEDEEEGELPASSPVSHNSLESAPMSESDSEGSKPEEDLEGPVFPYEKLFYSEKDKEEILALPEIQREEILSERAQQVDRRNQDIALRRLLAMRERNGTPVEKKKRKAAATDFEESQRKSTRQKTTLGGRRIGETSDAIEAYKRQREQKGKRDEQRRREAAKKKDDLISTPEGATPDREERSQSEVEWDEGKPRASSPPEDDTPADLKDFQRAKIGRMGFGQVCYYPRFGEVITGCYVRVNVGFNKNTGKDDYRMCMIKKIIEGKPYALEGPNGRNFVCNQYALLSQGKAEREFPFFACSEQPFTEAEFNRYRQTMVVDGFKMPTKRALIKKNQDIHRLINHQFTKEELEEKLRRQGTNDTKRQIYERIQLEKRRAQAVAAGDEAAIAECDAEMAKLAGPKLAFGTSLIKPRPAEKSQQERLEELNRRNQRLNAENIRKAQIEERRRERMNAAAVARGEALPDRFARVKTVARTYYDVNVKTTANHSEGGSGDTSRAITPQIATPGAITPNKGSTPKPMSKPAAAVTNGGDKKPSKGIPTIRHRPHDDEIIGALDFDIDIEL